MQLNHTRGASMGCITDASLIPSHDIYKNHYGGRRVKVTRLATGALHWPQRGSEARSGTNSEEAAHQLAAASRFKPRAGTPRDIWGNSMQLGLESNNLKTRRRVLGL
jgi:hypothetical protein